MLLCDALFFQRDLPATKAFFAPEGSFVNQKSFTLETSFSLEKGERLALTGPSGQGKTTLLLLLAGFLDPLKGSLIYEGEMITHKAPEQRPFSFLFQENNLFDHLTVLGNMALAFGRRTPTHAQIEEIEAVMTRFQVGGLLKRYPYELSGGQRRRMSLARCLLLRRPILLLDEPFNGVDSHTTQLIIQTLHQDPSLTVIFTSHQEKEIQALSTRELKISSKMGP